MNIKNLGQALRGKAKNELKFVVGQIKLARTNENTQICDIIIKTGHEK